MDREAYFEPAKPERPPFLASILMAGAYLLVVILLAIAIWQLEFYYPFSIYVFLGVNILIMCFLSAFGRYEFPKAMNFVFSFIIVLIPVLGTLYGLFYSGVAIARSKTLRAIVLTLLLTMTIVTFLSNAGMDKIRTNWLQPAIAKIGDPQAVLPTQTPAAKSTSAATNTKIAAPANQATEIPATPTASVAVPDCLHWSEITLDQLDQKLCVYGEYKEIYAKDQDTYIMTFSDQPGAFQIWSYPKPMEMYLPESGGACIYVTGWIKSSGTRPIILLRIYDIMESCSP